MKPLVIRNRRAVLFVMNKLLLLPFWIIWIFAELKPTCAVNVVNMWRGLKKEIMTIRTVKSSKKVKRKCKNRSSNKRKKIIKRNCYPTGTRRRPSYQSSVSLLSKRARYSTNRTRWTRCRIRCQMEVQTWVLTSKCFSSSSPPGMTRVLLQWGNSDNRLIPPNKCLAINLESDRPILSESSSCSAGVTTVQVRSQLECSWEEACNTAFFRILCCSDNPVWFNLNLILELLMRVLQALLILHKPCTTCRLPSSTLIIWEECKPHK